MSDSFGTRMTAKLGEQEVTYYSFAKLEEQGHNLSRLPYSLKVLLENLLRREDGVNVTRADVEALIAWDPNATPSKEIAFTPARVLLQDFTGVPCIVDLAAMRDAMVALGGDPDKINPLPAWNSSSTTACRWTIREMPRSKQSRPRIRAQ